MGVGTPLERFAAKFCAISRDKCPEIFYGDPFRDIFVPKGVGQRSGASSFTFFLVPGTRYQVLGPPKANFFEDVPSEIIGQEFISGSRGSRQSGPAFLTHRGSG